jgi:hypothetical protein
MALVVGAMLAGTALWAIGDDQCLDLSIVSFGCSHEHHIETETEIEESVVQTLDQRNDSSVEMTVITDQEVVLHFKNPKARVKNVVVSQTVDGHIKFVAEITQELQGDLRAVLKNDVDEKIRNLGPGTQAFFEKKPNGLTVEKVRTALYTAIDESTTQENLSAIRFQVRNTQKVNIYVYAKYVDGLVIDQNIALNVFARAVVEQASVAAMKSDTIKKLKRELETSSGATEGVSGTKIAAVVILLAIAAFGAYYYVNRKKKQDVVVVVPPASTDEI